MEIKPKITILDGRAYFLRDSQRLQDILNFLKVRPRSVRELSKDLHQHRANISLCLEAFERDGWVSSDYLSVDVHKKRNNKTVRVFSLTKKARDALVVPR